MLKLFHSKIGFIQGRLSPIVNGQIQAFPWNFWMDEFSIAKDNDFKIIEWTLDQHQLYKNPIMTYEGRKLIKNLSNKYGISILSLTGDCFMQSPFFKVGKTLFKNLIQDLKNIIISCADLGLKFIVFPLVDNGRLENKKQENLLKEGLALVDDLLLKNKIKIIFESDFSPNKLKSFIYDFSPNNYGINYDIGNSAAFGYSYRDEFSAYGERILNVHIKDRLLDGGTVPLGQGNADIPAVIRSLNSSGYSGNYILQTAREKGNDIGILCQSRDKILKWIS